MHSKELYLFTFICLITVFFLNCLYLVSCTDEDDEDISPTQTVTPTPTIHGEATSTETPIPSQSIYEIIDTAQEKCYDLANEISCPQPSETLYGQDAQYFGSQADYSNNGDGTVTDNNTGLMWQQDPGSKMTYAQAVAGAETFNLAGYDDWRLPSIKELYSLILFSGIDPSGWTGTDTSNLVPFIDTDYFMFEYGNPAVGERIIDSQFASSTEYVSTTMSGDPTVFGVNFADGRIKGYGYIHPGGGEKTFFVLYVRGNTDYGSNDLEDNGNGTINDTSTGLMWLQQDSGNFSAGLDGDGKLDWSGALAWAENLEYAGYSDWRLPNAKELQSIVDYTRSPATTSSPAIDPVFSSTSIIDEGGKINYPSFWTSTTHSNWSNHPGMSAVYIAFGEALGWMQDQMGNYNLLDVHGAGAQRSDPKAGNPEDYPFGRGPQGDVIRIYNFVRCVRNINN